MKYSATWIHEWVKPSLSLEATCKKLTMAGLEVEELVPAASAFKGIIVAKIKSITPHPEAERLNICVVSTGKEEFTIVCGATNVAVGLNVPLATIGATLADGLTIKEAKLRGIASYGMLCSKSELGLAEESDGLMVLPEDAPLGKDLREYLQLDDQIINIGLTPNRGDCLSIQGLAREIAALTKVAMQTPPFAKINTSTSATLPVTVHAPDACPRYVGRVIKNIKQNVASPIWLIERLRRSGVRTIHPVVDVMNYVMLELGQPMHAFDLSCITSGIEVRFAKTQESITLLDESQKQLNAETLVIADAKGPLAIAGVMGGLASAVSNKTQDIFLESAFFTPTVVAKQKQYYLLNSDSAYRYERGVDPELASQALERATDLITQIVGGQAGPSSEVLNTLPAKRQVNLPLTKLNACLGINLSVTAVNEVFQSLQFPYTLEHAADLQLANWQVSIPSYRFDLSLPEDLIEEVARIYGYDNIPSTPVKAALKTIASQVATPYQPMRRLLAHLGFHEIISYSFIEPKLQALIDPDAKARMVTNPISSDMAAMRTSLWPGLLTTLQYNLARQQNCIHLFEIGACFSSPDEKPTQKIKLGALLCGLMHKEQWGITKRKVDYFDLKGVLELFLKTIYPRIAFTFQPTKNSVLHPGQAADIICDGIVIGHIGRLHPLIEQKIGLEQPVFLFELALESINEIACVGVEEVSKYPEIRRDLSILVNGAIPAQAISDTIKTIAGDWLKDVFIFDVYHGKGISPGLKSLAVALIFSNATRTLVDEEVAALMEQVIKALQEQLGAELRS